MLSRLVAITRHDGLAGKYAGEIVTSRRHSGCAVELCDLARLRLERPLEDDDGVIAGQPLYEGKHSWQLQGPRGRHLRSWRRIGCYTDQRHNGAGREGDRS